MLFFDHSEKKVSLYHRHYLICLSVISEWKARQWINISGKNLQIYIPYFPNYLGKLYIRDRPRFFDQVGHQTTNASFGNKYFSLNNVIIRLTKIMNRADKN